MNTSPGEKLYAAVESEDYELAERLLEQGADTETSPSVYRTPLVLAINLKNAKLVALLVKHGADVNLMLNEEGLSPLCKAIRNGTPEITQILMGCDRLVVKRSKSSALLAAISTRQEELAFQLIDRGVRYSHTDGLFFNTLTEAAGKGMLTLFTWLEAQGEPLDLTEAERFTGRNITVNLMHKAVSGGSVEILEYLRLRGVPLEGIEVPLVTLAVYHNLPDAVTWLARHGVSLETPYAAPPSAWEPVTPLFLAVLDKQPECFKRLLEAGADMKPPNSPTLDAMLEATEPADKITEIYADYRNMLSDRLLQLQHDLGFANSQKPESETPLPTLPLVDGEGRPSLLALQLAGAGQLGEIFQPESWRRRPDDARALFTQLRDALPPHYRSRLDAVDMAWATPEAVSAGIWVATTGEKSLPSSRKL